MKKSNFYLNIRIYLYERDEKQEAKIVCNKRAAPIHTVCVIIERDETKSNNISCEGNFESTHVYAIGEAFISASFLYIYENLCTRVRLGQTNNCTFEKLKDAL